MLTFQLYYADNFQSYVYSVDIGNSVYASYEVIDGVYVFTVEQGRRFFLKLNGNVGLGTPDVYLNGHKLIPSPYGTIMVSSNSVEIQSVNTGHEGTYRIRSSNGAELTFRLVVTGMKVAFILVSYIIKRIQSD